MRLGLQRRLERRQRDVLVKFCGKLHRDLTLVMQDRFYLGGTDYQEGFFVLYKLLHGLDERRFFLTVRRLG